MSELRSFRFARNLSWNALGQVLLAVLNLALLPTLVNGLGLEGYGLYVLLQAASGYLMLLSFGSGQALVRWLSFSAGRGETRPMLDASRHALLMHFFGVLLGAACVAGLGEVILTRLVRLPAGQLDSGLFVLRCAAGGAVFAALVQFGGLVLQGLQRFDQQSLVTVSQAALSLGLAAGLAYSGRGVKAVAVSWAAVNAGMAAASLWLAWRRLEPAREKPSGKPVGAGEFYAWGLSQWLGPLAWMVVNQLDRLLIARSSASLAGVALYAVPANLLQRLQVFPAIVGTVLAPMLTELEGKSASEDLSRIYLKTVRVVLWAILPPLVVMFAIMPQFLSLWLGGRFGADSVWPARLLVVAQCFWLLGTMPGAVVFAKDRPWYVPAYSWAQALVSVAAWKLLIPRHGLLGVAEGALLAQALPVAWFLWAVHGRVLKLPWSRYLQALLAPAASAVLALAVSFPAREQVTTWPRLFFISGLAAGLFYLSTWFLMGAVDRDLIRRYLRGRV